MAKELEVAAREAFWRCHLERQREGGGSITKYCREHGLAESSFYAWRQRFERRDAAHDPDGSCGLPGRRQATALPSKSHVRSTPSCVDVAPGSLVRVTAPRCEPSGSDGVGLVALDIVCDASPQSSVAITSPTLEIVCPGGVVIRLREEVSMEVLQRVIVACEQSHRVALKSPSEIREEGLC